MKEFDFDNHVNNLPDCYNKDTSKNNYKILATEKAVTDGLRKDIEAIYGVLDLNNATGKTLDLYGEMMNQPRGQASDDQYIFMIRSKIMRNISGGDYKSVVKAICQTFDCEPSEVRIKETEQPCTVELVSLPLGNINTAGLTITQTIAMIKQLLPICTSVESVYFDGTFEFSAAAEYEEDDKAGFCDVESGTTGGYFGDFYSEENEIILPI